MNILLTGSSGYVGSRLALRLKSRGHYVVGIDRRAPEQKTLTDKFIQADLLESNAYSAALEATDLVCHLAAAKGDWGISTEEYERDNVHATTTILQAAHLAGVRRWVFYSTVSALGPSEMPLAENAPRRPTNAYGATKAKCEQIFENYISQTAAAQVINIRPSVVYGPENPSNTNIFRLIDAIWHNRFVMIGQGKEVKTTSFIENLLDAHLFLMERQQEYSKSGMETFHYVDAPAQTTAQLVSQICTLLGKKLPRINVPLSLASPLALLGDAAAAITGVDMPITSARVRKFCTATNFSAEKIRRSGFTQSWSNEQALRKTVEWYRDDFLTQKVCETRHENRLSLGQPNE